MQEFGDLFSFASQRRHFAESLTGLMVAEHKTITGISGEFAETADQSGLNRFLTALDSDVEGLNQRQLDLRQKDPGTRSPPGASGP